MPNNRPTRLEKAKTPPQRKQPQSQATESNPANNAPPPPPPQVVKKSRDGKEK